MNILYEIIEEGKTAQAVRICRVFALDGAVEIPEVIHGLPVQEIGPYAFAEVQRRKTPGEKFMAVYGGEFDRGDGKVLADGAERGKRGEGALADGAGCGKRGEGALAAGSEFGGNDEALPPVCGDRLTSLRLPPSLRKIGAYAFYGCEKLERVSIFSTATDLGAGLFTGCYGIRQLDVRIIPGEKSCLKEMLAELRQTLSLDYRGPDGGLLARLIFPEFFEESVENTPARILMREMHGCGHMYRNAFVGTDFQFLVYDRLFPYVQVEEKPRLVTELAINRLRFPCQLSQNAREVYAAYLEKHGREIIQTAAENQDTELVSFAAAQEWCGEGCMEDMLSQAAEKGMAQFTGILMDARYEQRKRERGGQRPEPTRQAQTASGAVRRKRRFEL